MLLFSFLWDLFFIHLALPDLQLWHTVFLLSIDAHGKFCAIGRFSHGIRLCATPWTVELATRLLCPWGFSRQECCSGVPFPVSGHLPDPGIEPQSLMSPSLAGRFFTTSATWEACGMWDPVSQPEIKPRHLALGVGSLSHWTTREVLGPHTF